MSQLRTVGRPAVVFVDECGWSCFFQLAAVVRRAGFRTIRVSTTAPGRVASFPGLLFDRTVVLESTAFEDLPDILRGESIVDVQAVEDLAVAAYAALHRTVSSPLAEYSLRRSSAVDKLVVSETLRGAGVSAPATLVVDGSSAREAVERLGLPIVYKPRTGSGGGRVHIAGTLAELEAIVAHEEQPTEAFFEQFVAGRSLNVGVFAPSGDIVVGAAWVPWSRGSQLGPATEIETVEHPELFRVAQDVIGALQLRGLIGLGIMEDADGTLWAHDVNPRVWGSFLASGKAGSDFAAAYISWLCGEPPSDEPRWAVPGVRAWVFPDEISGSLVARPRPVAFRRLLRSLRTYGTRLGWRYVAFVVLSRRAEMLRVLTARRR